LRVPDDVSVVGFDDIQSAAYQNPALTTVRQPLREMGRMPPKLCCAASAVPDPIPTAAKPWSNPN